MSSLLSLIALLKAFLKLRTSLLNRLAILDGFCKMYWIEYSTFLAASFLCVCVCVRFFRRKKKNFEIYLIEDTEIIQEQNAMMRSI
jgi:hypothetical protein